MVGGVPKHPKFKILKQMLTAEGQIYNTNIQTDNNRNVIT